MKRASILLVLALLGAGPASLRAQILWPGTAAGMAVEEVQRTFPTAHAPEDPATLPNDRGVELLELDEVAVAGNTFTVKFFFRERQLMHVALSETGEIPVKEFEKFRTLLRGKYGMEYSTLSSEYIQVTWKAVRTVILLTWAPQGHGVARLTISYEAPLLPETYRL
jgi:hypothetical protein